MGTIFLLSVYFSVSVPEVTSFTKKDLKYIQVQGTRIGGLIEFSAPLFLKVIFYLNISKKVIFIISNKSNNFSKSSSNILRVS